MAITIDLLPGYVGLRRWFKRILAVCVALVAATGALLFLLYYHQKLELDKWKEDVVQIKTFEDKANAVQAEADKVKADAEPNKRIVTFLADAGQTGPERTALLALCTRYIYDRAVVSSLDLSDGKTVKLSVTLQTPDDYYKYLLRLYAGSDANPNGPFGKDGKPIPGPLFTGLPSSTGPPGFPPPRPEAATVPGAQPAGQGSGSGSGGEAPGQAPVPISSTEPTLIVFPLKMATQGNLQTPLNITVPPEPDKAAAPAAGAPGEPGAPAPAPTGSGSP